MISKTPESYHTPALVKEVVDILSVGPGGNCIDATIGDGGHAAAILKTTSPNGQLLGIDGDPQALIRVRARLGQFADRLILSNENFSSLESIVDHYSFHPVLGIILDLGISSWQLEAGNRGFSFSEDIPLDMRINPSQSLTASEVVNGFSPEELTEVIKKYGEEPHAKRIALSIIRHRPLKTAIELARVIEACVPRHGRRLHPATRTFQAIRILVNQELENLETVLRQAIRVLAMGGRLAVIAYHSLEDRIVKTFMRRESSNCLCPPYQLECNCDHRATLRILTKKVIKASIQERLDNPRVRSARLRACALLQNT
jgi:16S rRNA (cytosine1402-N4)-methyltransferase